MAIHETFNGMKGIDISCNSQNSMKEIDISCNSQDDKKISKIDQFVTMIWAMDF